MTRRVRVFVWVTTVAVAAALVNGVLDAQAGGGAPPADGRAGARGQGRGGPPGGAPVPFNDRTGFREIFDGKALGQWDGNPAFWRVENGAIVGETTRDNPLKENTFIVWRGGEPADFELKLEFRINSTNSGVQYRSVELTDVGKWVLKGYQADIDFNNQFTGMLYEERGRAFLAPRGTFGYIGPNQPARGAAQTGTAAGVRGPIGALESGDALKAYIKVNDWNQFHVVARGNVLVHVLNGHVTALFVDDDPVGRAMKGLIGLQLHVGDPMKVEFRNIWLKTL